MELKLGEPHFDMKEDNNTQGRAMTSVRMIRGQAVEYYMCVFDLLPVLPQRYHDSSWHGLLNLALWSCDSEGCDTVSKRTSQGPKHRNSNFPCACRYVNRTSGVDLLFAKRTKHTWNAAPLPQRKLHIVKYEYRSALNPEFRVMANS